MVDWLFNFFKTKEEYKYNYQKFGDTEAPILDVTFKYNSSTLSAKAFVDSGADITIIPKTLGEALKLEKTILQYVGGIGGKMGYYLNTIEAEIAGTKLKLPVAVATQDTVPLLLGRKGFFEIFEVSFNDKEKFIMLKKI